MKKFVILMLISSLTVLASCGEETPANDAAETIKKVQEEAMKDMTPEQKMQFEAAQKAQEEALKSMTPEQKAQLEAAQKAAADAINAQ